MVIYLADDELMQLGWRIAEIEFKDFIEAHQP
jgi:hypothetical protein